MEKVVHRKTGIERDLEISKSQKFLYRTFLGRILVKLLIRPFLSKLVGAYMNSGLSKRKIKKFIKKNSINIEEYEMKDIACFNDFFSRKIKAGMREIAEGKNIFISPCDAKLSVYKIEEDSIFQIKDAYYRISDLIEDATLASEYTKGFCFVFRLAVDDYHRYCYIDDGYHEESTSIPGVFHTVNPICLEKYNFFKKNHREWTILHTLHFGDIIQVEVGAMMVGKIDNYFSCKAFKKGEEKGLFLFGGSTIVVITKDNILVDEDILKASLSGNEITVQYGEQIGVLK